MEAAEEANVLAVIDDGTGTPSGGSHSMMEKSCYCCFPFILIILNP
jgi:hypothetical protein